jgi:CRISPR-associated protein Cas5t
MAGGLPKALDVLVQPTRREFLLGGRLVLYLDRPEYRAAFEAPRFSVVLGRSQDLACYIGVEEVTLVRADAGYFEHTILPFGFRRRTGRGVTVLMPRYIGPPPLREATFDRFIILQERVFLSPQGDREIAGRYMVNLEGEPLELWVDPDSPEWDGMRRAIWLEPFVA